MDGSRFFVLMFMTEQKSSYWQVQAFAAPCSHPGKAKLVFERPFLLCKEPVAD